jgi:hypothetical protein
LVAPDAAEKDMLVSSSSAFLASALCLLSSLRAARGQAIAEPAGNQIIFGSWVQTDYGAQSWSIFWLLAVFSDRDLAHR